MEIESRHSFPDSESESGPGPAGRGRRPFAVNVLLMRASGFFSWSPRFVARVKSRDNRRFVSHGFCHCVRSSRSGIGTRRFVACFGSEGLSTPKQPSFAAAASSIRSSVTVPCGSTLPGGPGPGDPLSGRPYGLWCAHFRTIVQDDLFSKTR